MTTWEIILAFLSFIFGSSGVFSTVMFFKQSKRLKEIETYKAEVDVESGKIDNNLKLAEYTKTLLESCERNSKEICERFNSREEEFKKAINSINKQILELQIENSKLKTEIEKLTITKCTVFNCPNRVPPTKF